jgi:hypothetical protein
MKAIYTLIDTSILSVLLKDQKYLGLSGKYFADKFGLPFITIYNLQELAGVETVEQFENRITKLSTLGNIVSIMEPNTFLPGQVSDIIMYEIEAKYKYGARTFNEIKEHVVDKCSLVRLDFDHIFSKYLFDETRRLNRNTHLVSMIRPNTYNPFENKPISKILNYYFEFDPLKINLFFDQFKNELLSRGKDIDEKKLEEMVEDYKVSTEDLKSKASKFERVIDFIAYYADEKIDLNKSLRYYLNCCQFAGVKKNLVKMMLLDSIPANEIKMSDSPIFSFQMEMMGNISDQLQKDKMRKIKKSNLYDIYIASYASYALYVNVLVDKRIFPVMENLKEKLNYDLQYRKIDYDDFIN